MLNVWNETKLLGHSQGHARYCTECARCAESSSACSACPCEIGGGRREAEIRHITPERPGREGPEVAVKSVREECNECGNICIGGVSCPAAKRLRVRRDLCRTTRESGREKPFYPSLPAPERTHRNEQAVAESLCRSKGGGGHVRATCAYCSGGGDARACEGERAVNGFGSWSNRTFCGQPILDATIIDGRHHVGVPAIWPGQPAGPARHIKHCRVHASSSRPRRRRRRRQIGRFPTSHNPQKVLARRRGCDSAEKRHTQAQWARILTR